MLEFLLEWGYLGIFIGCFLAATVVPFASDALLVGMLLAGGDVWMTVACASAGNWLGGLTTYGIGRIGKWEWIEKWFRVKQETIEKQKVKVDKWGPLLALATWVLASTRLTSSRAQRTCSSARPADSSSGPCFSLPSVSTFPGWPN